MAETKRWSGNTTTEISLYDDELDRLLEFVNAHEQVYIFGKGKIGMAIGHYCKQAGIKISGHIVSDEWNEFVEIYKEKEIGVLIGVSDRYLEEIMDMMNSVITEKDIFLLSSTKRESMGSTFSKTSIMENFWLNIYVTSTCNLNCKSCSAFAPICKPDYYEVEQFQKDMLQMKKMNLSNISVIKFTGAEPLLHPDIFSLFEIARQVFPTIGFECYTNGLLLISMSEEKLRLLKKQGVTLVVTEYPLGNLDLEKAYGKLDKVGVSYNVIFSEGQKYFSKRPLNFQKNTPKHLFYYCPRYKMCDSLFLFRGKLYKCIYTLSAGYFNEAFDKSLEVLKEDYLDIYKISAQDVYQYCISRIPFCGYCSQIEETVPWGLSERKIEEWT